MSNSDDREEKTRVTSIQPQLPTELPRGGDCLVVIYTKEPTLLGKRYVLDMSHMRVGRGAENHVVLDGDSVSRRHAHFEQRGAAWCVVDNNSTNGTYVNDVQIRDFQELRNGDRIKIGGTIFKYLSGQDVEAQYHEEIYRMTIIDGLTGAHVKRFFLEALEKEILRSRRHQRPLCLMMFDIDFFKKINDVHGHLAGDYVLKELARLIAGRIRRDEVFARYGGEEFSIICSETTLEGAAQFAETLREMIAGFPFVFQGEQIPCTISIGVAELADERTSADFIQVADGRLYEAKHRGRNRVIAA